MHAFSIYISYKFASFHLLLLALLDGLVDQIMCKLFACKYFAGIGSHSSTCLFLICRLLYQMAIQNIIRRLLIIRKSFRATAVLAWVFELITLTMELIGDNTRFDKLAAIFLTMDSCFFTFWDVHIKFKDRSLAFGRVGRCYFWPKHENGHPSWSPDVVCDVCSSVFVVCHFVVAVVDFVYRGHGPTYVFTLAAFVLASLALIPTQAYHRWLSATDHHQPDDRQVGSTADIDPDHQQHENEEARVGIEVHHDDPSVSASVGDQSMDINLQSEIQCLQSMHN